MAEHRAEETKPKMKKLFVEMPPEIHQKLKDLAYVRGLTIKDYIIEHVQSQPDPQINRPVATKTSNGG